jgi:alkylhydroperoxidase family enzyme
MPQHRRSPPEIAPDGYRAVSGVEAYTRGCGLEGPLIELVEPHGSQINGYTFCLDMHYDAGGQRGEIERCRYLLNAWRDAPFRPERKRPALVRTEHLTRFSTGGAPDTACERLGGLSAEVDVEVANLPELIGPINLRNRVAVGGGFHLAAALPA